MREKKLFTTDKNVISERKVYLCIIAEELRSHRYRKFLGNYITVPTDIAIKYIRYLGLYDKKFQTCLNRFDGKSSDFFSAKNKDHIIQLYNNKTRKIIDNLLEYVLDKTEKRRRKETITIKIDENHNTQAHNHLKNKYFEENQIHLEMLPNTTLDEIERELKKLAQFGLMSDAFDHAKVRADMEGKYEAKKLVNTIDEIFEDLVINDSTKEPKAGYKDMDLKEVVNEAVNKYEIKDNPDYLININNYKSAIRGNFKPKLEKFTTSED